MSAVDESFHIQQKMYLHLSRQYKVKESRKEIHLVTKNIDILYRRFETHEVLPDTWMSFAAVCGNIIPYSFFVSTFVSILFTYLTFSLSTHPIVFHRFLPSLHLPSSALRSFNLILLTYFVITRKNVLEIKIFLFSKKQYLYLNLCIK